MGTWYNADGLNVRLHDALGVRGVNRVVSHSVMGRVHELTIPYDLTKIAAGAVSYTTDRDNDGTADGFDGGEVFIPAGASVLSCDIVTSEAAAGGTAIAVGTFTEAGAAIDADGFVTTTEGAIANMGAVGEIVIGAGALLATTSGKVGLTANSWVGITASGTYTAGKGVITIKYLSAVAA